MPILPPTLRALTRDLSDVPLFVQFMLSLFPARILAWVSQQLYRAVLSRCAAHPLVRLAQLYDLASVAACQAYQHAPGTKGYPPTPSTSSCALSDFTHFTPTDFRVSADGTNCTCPNGIRTTHTYVHDRESISFRAMPRLPAVERVSRAREQSTRAPHAEIAARWR